MRGLILLLIFALILETIFYPFPFTLVVVIMGVLTLSVDSFAFVFLAGLFLDIFSLNILGLDSLIFLAVTAFILRYNRRINFSNYFSVIVFILITTTAYELVIYRKAISIWMPIISILISYILLLFLPKIVPGARSNKKLRV